MIANLLVVPSVFIGILLTLKLYALTYHIRWIHSNADECTDEFGILLHKWQSEEVQPHDHLAVHEKFKILFSHDDWPLHRVLFGKTPPGKRRLTGYLFYLPVLVLFQSLLLSCSVHEGLGIFGIFILWANLTASFVQTVYARYWLAYLDSFLRHTTVTRKPLGREEMILSNNRYRRDTMTVYFGLACTLAVGYAGIYIGLQRISHFTAFPGVDNTPLAPLHFLFNSTIAYVAFALPEMNTHSEIAHILVLSQFITSWAFVVFLFAQFNITTSPQEIIEDSQRKQARRISAQSAKEDFEAIVPKIETSPKKRSKCKACGNRRVLDSSGKCNKCAGLASTA